MICKLGSLFAAGALGVVGCGVGSGDSGSTPDAPPSQMDAMIERTSLCTAQVTLTGTFTAAAPLIALNGCQPQGTWAVTAAVADKGTCATVPLKSSYSYALSGSGRTTKITYSTATGEEFQGSVIATGSGGCKGSFEHIQADGGQFGQLVLQPLLPTPPDGVTELEITGTGEFQLWQSHP